MKKNILYIFIGLLVIGMIGAVFGEDDTINKLSLDARQLSLDIHDEEEIKVLVEPSDATLLKSDFTISDEKLIEITHIDHNLLTIKTLSNEGHATISYNKNNIKSNEVTIKIVDQKKLALEKIEKQRQEEKAQKEKELAEKKKQEETNRTQQNSKPNQTINSSSNSATKPTSTKVYITPTGKKYHSIPKCGNTKSSSLVSLNEAVSIGLDPCRKCY